MVSAGLLLLVFGWVAVSLFFRAATLRLRMSSTVQTHVEVLRILSQVAEDVARKVFWPL